MGSIWERQRLFSGAGTFLRSSDGEWHAELRADGDLCVVGGNSSVCRGSAQAQNSSDYIIAFRQNGDLCRLDHDGKAYACEFGEWQGVGQIVGLGSGGGGIMFNWTQACRWDFP